MRPRTIQYAICPNGLVYSRVDNEVCVPVLDYEGMKPENNFIMVYNLDKFSIYSISSEWNTLKWTRKIPVELKNIHRKFWGMKELKEKQNAD